MNVSTEIKNKEKSLAELMVKILKEPLNPLESSMQALNDEVLDAKELIEAINDTLGASADAVDKMNKMVKQQFAGMRNDDIPTLIASVQTYIAQQATKHTDNVALSLGEHSMKQEEHFDAAAEKVLTKLTSILNNYQEVKQSIAELSQQLTSVSQSIHIGHANIAQTLDVACGTIVKDVEAASGSITKMLAESLSEIRNVAIQQQNSHSALREQLNLRQTNLSDKLSVSQRTLRMLTIMVGIFFFSMAAYIGYDIWHQFH